MTAPELAAFLRDGLAGLDAAQPGAARARTRGRWEETRAAFTAAAAAETGLPGEFVQRELDRREELLQSAAHSFDAWRLAADTGFVTAVMAAAAWTTATPARGTTRKDRP